MKTLKFLPSLLAGVIVLQPVLPVEARDQSRSQQLEERIRASRIHEYQSFMARGEKAFAQGRYQDAASACDHATSLASGREEEFKAFACAAESYKKAGDEYVRDGNSGDNIYYRSARSSASSALEIDPGNAQLRAFLEEIPHFRNRPERNAESDRARQGRAALDASLEAERRASADGRIAPPKEEEMQRRAPSVSGDINLVRNGARTAIHQLRVGDAWEAARGKNTFKAVDRGECRGRVFLESFAAKVGDRTLTAYVSDGKIVRLQLSVPHEPQDRQQLEELITARHGKPLRTIKLAMYYTPVAVSNLSDVSILINDKDYDINVFDTKKFTEIVNAGRACGSDLAVEQVGNIIGHLLGALSKVEGSSSGGSEAGGRTESGSGGNAGGWGALAIDHNQGDKWGFSHQYASEREASDRARRECDRRGGMRCQVMMTFQGGCAAYAASRAQADVFGWGHQETESAAKSRALSECGARGSSCVIRAWSCN